MIKAQNFTELQDDLFDFAFIFDKTWQKEMSKNFLKYKLSFSQMISDLIIWIDENMQKYSSLYIWVYNIFTHKYLYVSKSLYLASFD